jgi:hypothetical protein
MSRLLKFFGWLSLQCLVLGLLAFLLLTNPASHGRMITLEVSPPNRRDAMRQKELALVFPASCIERESLSMQGIIPHRTTIYAVLRQSGRYYEVKSASLEPPKISEGEVIIQGNTVGESVPPENIWVQFGFERCPNTNPTESHEIRGARVWIDPDGNGQIVQLVYNSSQWR